MAIQMRRGQLANYDKSKMLPGEWGISIDNDSDNQKAFISFAPGVSKEVMMVEDAEEQIAVATAEAIDMATEEAEAWAHGNSFHVNDYASGDGSTKSFTLAETPSSILGVYVDGSSVSAYTLSGKTITFTTAPASGSNNIRVYYTVNTTTDNAKYYKEQAEAVAESIPEDYSELSEDVDQLKNALKATEIVDTASGAIASFPDGGDGFPVRDLKVQMAPIQDLHGYDHPWSARGGKNLIPMTVTDIKAVNPSGTWSGNSWDKNGVTFTIMTDNAGNVTGINVNGTSSAETYFRLSVPSKTLYSESCIASVERSIYPCFFADSYSGKFNVYSVARNFAGGESNIEPAIKVPNGVSVSNVVVKPMICLASATDPTVFAPYSNICPISGRDSVKVTRTGVNVWDEEWEQGGISITNGNNVSVANAIRSKNYCKCLPNTVYFLTTPTNAKYVFWYDENRNHISNNYMTKNGVATSPSNACYFRLRIDSYGTTYNHDISINYPSTDTDYHAGHVQTIEIPLGQTVYGGTLDMANGTLTVDRTLITLDGSDDELWGNYTSNYGGYRLEIPDSKIDGVPKVQLKSNMYVGADSRSVTYPIIMGIMETYLSPSDDKYVFFTTDITTKADWLTWLGNNNVELAYPLATPTTIQLTPQQITTLLGQNNVWSDADSVSVDYVADTKLYIAKVIADALS